MTIDIKRAIQDELSARDSAMLCISNGYSDGEPDFDTVKSALLQLNPNCDEETQTHRRLGPLANAARSYPHTYYSLKGLAEAWWSEQWRAPNTDSEETSDSRFENHWRQLILNYAPAKNWTLTSIYSDAAAAGWPVPSPFPKSNAIEEMRDNGEEFLACLAGNISLMLKCIGDGNADAPMEPEFTDSLLMFREHLPEEYCRIKDLIKIANPAISLSAVDAAVKEFANREE